MTAKDLRLITIVIPTAAVLLLAVAISGGAAEPNTSFFTKVSLNPPPQWLSSAAWGPSDTVIVVDAFRSKVQLYSRSGDYQESARLKTDSLRRPSILREAIDGTYLLEVEDGILQEYDSQFRFLRSVDILQESKGGTSRLAALYGWVPRKKNEDILAFVDLENTDKTWSSAFVRVPLGDPASYEVLETLKLDDPGRDYYLLGYSYLAATSDGTGYYLLMSEEPVIKEVSSLEQGGRSIVRDVGVFPRGFGRRVLRDRVGRAGDLFLAMEDARAPAGLYASKDFLYVLSRKPMKGNTAWFLSQIKPSSKGDEIVYENLLLPTCAPHIALLSGNREWVIIERGEVVGLGDQHIPRMTFIAATWIQEKGVYGPTWDQFCDWN